MEEFIWRNLKTVLVPQHEGATWTPALDFLIPKRLYRFQVNVGKGWKLDGASDACNADGYNNLPSRNGDPICATAPFGALIAKVGGGTADKAGIIFGVGRYCVYKITTEETSGPLYLGANDIVNAMPQVTGQLEVEIEIAL